MSRRECACVWGGGGGGYLELEEFGDTSIHVASPAQQSKYLKISKTIKCSHIPVHIPLVISFNADKWAPSPITRKKYSEKTMRHGAETYHFTAETSEEKLSSSKMMSAASRAMEVPLFMANPTSAMRSAGASFVPSPVIATISLGSDRRAAWWVQNSVRSHLQWNLGCRALGQERG